MEFYSGHTQGVDSVAFYILSMKSPNQTQTFDFDCERILFFRRINFPDFNYPTFLTDVIKTLKALMSGATISGKSLLDRCF